ncbi:MAG: hypothetical protein VKJ66_08005 [Synechococcus sp.]|nr:hypothetical protein [Synechococcus sp.]
MNLVALLVAAVLLGIGAPFAVQLLSTPLRSTADLTGQTTADAFAERLQIELRRSEGTLALQGDALSLARRDGSSETIQAPEGCRFRDAHNGASGIFVQCPNPARPESPPGVAALVTAAPCGSDLFPGRCPD